MPVAKKKVVKKKPSVVKTFSKQDLIKGKASLENALISSQKVAELASNPDLKKHFPKLSAVAATAKKVSRFCEKELKQVEKHLSKSS